MKKTLFATLLFLTTFLTGCVGYVMPTYGPSGYYNSQPRQYYGPSVIYSQAPIYSEYYTPPIDYRKPEGVWYPWGNMRSDNHPQKSRERARNDDHRKKTKRGHKK